MVFGEGLAVRTYDVPLPGLDDCGGGVRIAHVSDFHFRRWNDLLDQVRWRLLQPDYDLLVVTGDLCSIPAKWRHAANMCRRLFDGIAPPLGTYAVMGNHDRPRLARQPGLPFRWLDNEHVCIKVKGLSLYLAGVDQSEGKFGDAGAALSGVPADGPVVMLAHYPSTVFDLASDRVGLVLSGHTHGGQIRLPGIGCLFTNDRIPTRMSRGLHRVGGTRVHVSAGIGMSGPIHCRFRCPPEITFLTLTTIDSNVGESTARVPSGHKRSRARELVLEV
ncbi:MAG: metallophosphoesterase [Phycisphaerae bacterium]